jgi:GntR family transcriptional regulator, transcriptional repressor for pyruvate dehydrogenase complex
LVQELLTRQIESGSVIDAEGDLVRRLNVSRATLREGLRLLETLGIVQSRLGRAGGIVVGRPKVEDFAQIFTFYLQFTSCTYRQLLEVNVVTSPLVLASAARTASEADRDRLRGVMRLFDALPLADQVRQVQTVTATLIDMVDNPIWRLFAQSIHIVVSQELERILVPESEWPAVVRQVRRIATAVLDGDAARTESLTRAQIEAWIQIARDHQAELLDAPIVWSS